MAETPPPTPNPAAATPAPGAQPAAQPAPGAPEDPPKPAAKPSGKKSLMGCLFGLVAGLVVMVALIAFGVVKARENAINQFADLLNQQAPAESWDVDLSYGDFFALAQGKPFDFDVMGVNIKPREGDAVFPELSLDVNGMVLDPEAQAVKAVDTVDLELVLSQETVAQLIKQDARVGRAFEDLEVSFEGGRVKLSGLSDARVLGLDQLAGLGQLEADATAVAVVDPPSTVGLELTEGTVSLPEGNLLGNLASRVGVGDEMDVAPKVLEGISRDLRLDLSEVWPGLQLHNVTIEAGGVRLKGDIAPQSLIQGGAMNPAEPASPDAAEELAPETDPAP